MNLKTQFNEEELGIIIAKCYRYDENDDLDIQCASTELWVSAGRLLALLQLPDMRPRQDRFNLAIELARVGDKKFIARGGTKDRLGIYPKIVEVKTIKANEECIKDLQEIIEFLKRQDYEIDS